MRIDEDLIPAKPIYGGTVLIRTFHGFDRGPRENRRTIDQLVAITLPAINGERFTIVPTMKVEL
jgi:hypothetical protein